MANLLIEIRCEELPARSVRPAAEAFQQRILDALRDRGLLPEDAEWPVESLGTCRRLVAAVRGVSPGQAERIERAWGPAVAAAFSAAGEPTRAAEGFARSVGVAVGGLQRGEKAPGKTHLFHDRVVPGRSAAELLPGIIEAALRALPFRKWMRWPGSDLPFARPIRGVLVLLDGAVVPCRIAGVPSGRATRGHPYLRPEEFVVEGVRRDGSDADGGDFVIALRERCVLLPSNTRRDRIADLVRGARLAAGGTGAADPTGDGEAALLEEVAGLVEWPHALVGAFDPSYADLPQSILTTAMAHHLRFFPVRDSAGRLLPKFVSVIDRDARHADAIRAGNERVLRARLYDARFFFDNDRKRPLEAFRPALAGVDFHRGLGTLLDKSEHVRAVAADLAGRVGLNVPARRDADRAALLLKCDLVTEVVKEFPELQGEIGAEYARRDGEREDVALALLGQYPPRHERAAVLESPAACVVSLAEKADSLAAYFSIGEEPTGSADPFGLRRHALALLHLLEKTRWPLSIEAALAAAAARRNVPAEAMGRLHAFVWGRAEQRARDAGHVDFLDAVGARTDLPFHEVGDRLAALRALSADHGRWRDLIALVERSGNMGRAGPVDGGALPPEGRTVAAALERVRRDAAAGAGGASPEAAVEAHRRFAASYADALAAPVGALFDAVLVDDPSAPERSAALKALLHDVFALFRDRLGDLRRLGAGARPPRG